MYRRNLPLIVVVFLASRTSVTPTLDLTGRAVTPGLVGMHDHLFYGSSASTRRSGGLRRST
jgi:imidazolonepropionase-like amidohydrolase